MLSVQAGQQLGNYRLVRLLGKGSFADVFLGEHLYLSVHAAIKVLHTRANDDAVEAFRKEARTIALLKHPHIVRILDFNVQEGTPFLVMDYAPNGTLRRRYPRGTRLPLTKVVAYIEQLADALEHAHEKRIIHRNIKPENMLLGSNNEVLLSDFGITIETHSNMPTKSPDSYGIIPYMAPEQIQGKPCYASDQYALAIVAYEWMTGNPPFQGTFAEIYSQQMFAPAPSLHEKAPEIPQAVEEVIRKALTKDYKGRFASISAFAQALRQASQSVDQPTIPGGAYTAKMTSSDVRSFTEVGLTDPVYHCATDLYIEEALAQLPSMDRSCLLLCLVDGFTEHEIAEILDINEKNVRAHFSRGHEQFRRTYRFLESEGRMGIEEPESCDDWVKWLAIAPLEDPSSADLATLNQHLTVCTKCADIYEDYQLMDARIRELSFVEPPPGLPRLILDYGKAQNHVSRSHDEALTGAPERLFTLSIQTQVLGGETREQVPQGLNLHDPTQSIYHTVTATSEETDDTTPWKPYLAESRNPYKGLRAFTKDDAADFFGRDSLIGELVETMKSIITLEKQGAHSTRLLTVIGPSGSGKSSVVMAGLLPQLQKGAIPGSEQWVYLKPLVLGKHALDSLISTLAPLLSDRSLKSIREDLEGDSTRGLHLLATQLVKRSGTRVLLVVDQLEELFAQTVSENERQHFLDLLTTAVMEPGGPVVAMLTLQADFYGRSMSYPALSVLMQKNLIQVLPMEIPDLQAIIEKPATASDVQLTFEGNLVGDLLFEVHGQSGALPLLQFTLDQLFQHRHGHLLTLQAYHELGSLKGALQQYAEKTYAALPSEEHRRMTWALFMRLIDLGATEQGFIRRRAVLSELSLADVNQNHLLQETIDAFIAARLLTTNEVAGTITVEISHDALIREWPRLAGWLRVAREDIPLQQTIDKGVVMWEGRGKSGERLYYSSQLKEAKAWAKDNRPSKDKVAFLRVSTAHHRIQFVMSMVVLVLLSMLASTAGIAGWLLHPLPSVARLVTTLNDDGPGSLRQAIANARLGDTITFDPSLKGTIVLTGEDLNISQNLTIHGPGAGVLSISSGNIGLKVHVLQNASVTISGLTFKDNKFTSFIANAGILELTNSTISGNTAENNGGGIVNMGRLTLTNSTVFGNTVYGANGGGIYNDNGTLTLINSTVSDNTAVGGGGIYNDNGTLTLINSTVSDNTAVGGGGIYNLGSIFALTNSTISGNMASGNGGGIYNSGSQVNITFCTIYGNTTSGNGGGIFTEGAVDFNGNKISSSVTIRNSLVVGNHASNSLDIAGTITSDGYNLVQNISGAIFLDPNKKHSTDQYGNQFPNLKIDPKLQNNGGPTQTHALLPGSPAIDKIPLDICRIKGISTDQRGTKRPQGPACDIGAYEATSPRVIGPPPFSVIQESKG